MMEEKIYVHGYLQLQEIHILHIVSVRKSMWNGSLQRSRSIFRRSLLTNLINKEQVEKIHNFLKNMKDPYKILFELRIHGELSFEKIGRIFGKSSGWARVTYYRAKMKILEYMEAENNE